MKPSIKERKAKLDAAVKLILRASNIGAHALRGMTVTRAADLVHEALIRGTKKTRPSHAATLKVQKDAFRFGFVTAAGGPTRVL